MNIHQRFQLKLNPIPTLILLTVTLVLAGAQNSGAAPSPYYPAHDPGVFVVGHARFTVITPTLIRMEYSSTGTFINKRSYFAYHRNIKPPIFQASHHGHTLMIKIQAMRLIYTPGGSGFTATNLSIAFRNGNAMATWHPGMKQTENLGGTVRTLDGCSGPFPLPNGLLSRNGWFLLPDETFLLSNGPKPWCLARPAETDWYFFGYGRNYHTALRDLTTVSGKVPLPRRYALGAWHSRYWSFTQAQFKELVRDYNLHRFPLDNMVMDMGWHKTDGWTGFSWNRHLIEHPRELLAWLHHHGLHVTLNLHPAGGVGNYETRYKEFCRGMGVSSAGGKTIPFDCTNRLFMHNYFHVLLDPLEHEGVSFWWLDWQQGRTSAIPGVDPLPWLNELDFRDSQRPSTHRRGLSFSRWGGWGGQRYPIEFSGDTHAIWPVLKFEIPFTSVAGNVGCFYWSHDIGGHMAVIPNPELYTRWVQFGSASPVLRTHATAMAGDFHRPWFFGAAATHACRRAFDLRSRIFPYIYTSSWRCYQDSVPLIRPMYFDHQANPLAYKFPEEYMLGRNILVAPIVAPGRGPGKIGHSVVWFPKGTWYNLFTGEHVNGGQVATVWAALDEFPIYAQGGVPIPMQKPVLRMAEHAPNPLVVTVYPGANGKSIFYEDDGKSKGYLHGQHAITALAYKNFKDASIGVNIGAAIGTYNSEKPLRNVVICLPQTSRPIAVTVNGKPLPRAASATDIGYVYRPATVTTIIRIGATPVGMPELIHISFSHAAQRGELIRKITNQFSAVTRAMAGNRSRQYPWVLRLDQIQFHLETLRAQVADEHFRHWRTWNRYFTTLNAEIASVARSPVHGGQSGAVIARQILAKTPAAIR
ncbi:MAG: TIM-barrel domain-containing protein [Phycisphaerae bacterium]